MSVPNKNRKKCDQKIAVFHPGRGLAFVKFGKLRPSRLANFVHGPISIVKSDGKQHWVLVVNQNSEKQGLEENMFASQTMLSCEFGSRETYRGIVLCVRMNQKQRLIGLDPTDCDVIAKNFNRIKDQVKQKRQEADEDRYSECHYRYESDESDEDSDEDFNFRMDSILHYLASKAWEAKNITAPKQ
jgi:hypothetical protein